MDTKLGDYVIVHELLHLSVANHGKHWKNVHARAHLGNWEKIEQRLKVREDKSAGSGNRRRSAGGPSSRIVER